MKFFKEYKFEIAVVVAVICIAVLIHDRIDEGREQYMTTCMDRTDLQAFPKYMRKTECHAEWMYGK